MAARRGAGASSPRGGLPTQPALRSSSRWLSSSAWAVRGPPPPCPCLPPLAGSPPPRRWPFPATTPGRAQTSVCAAPLAAALLACCSGRGSAPCSPHPALRPPISQSRDRHVAASGRTPCALQGPQPCLSAFAPFPMRPPLACPVSPGLSPGVSPGAAPLPPCHLTPPGQVDAWQPLFPDIFLKPRGLVS